jgi:hypothetical protein
MRLPPPDTKVNRVLEYFLMCQSANRFEAERRLNDHCLHSTVSTLQNEYGIKISRRFEVVPGYKGSRTRCCRYWIDPEERERIKNLIRQKEKASRSDQTQEGFQNSKIDNKPNGDIRQIPPAE